MAEFTLPAPEPGSISPSLDLLTKDVIPNAREVYDAQNPMSQFKEVEPNLVDAGGAKLIDMNARARLGGFRSPMSQFKEVDSPTLPGFKEADDLDVKSVEELDKARDTFRPAEYFSSNPDLPNDPKKLAKLIEVYRRRDEEGLVAGRVISAATKGTPSLLADIGGGIKRFGERAVDAVVQPTANVVLGTLTGDLFDDQKRAALFSETRKTVKKAVAEGSAGAESAGVSLADLSRQGAQKVEAMPGIEARGGIEGLGIAQIGEKYTAPKPKTDQQLLAQLSDDASFQKNAADILTGQGEAAKNFGLDKETLAKQGIELDENAIRQLSLVDPITMVATGGAFKLVGLGGKLLGTARTLEGAQQLTDKLAKVASVSRTAKIAGGILEGSGKVVAETKGFGGRSLTAAGAIIGGAGGDISGGIVTAAVTKAATKAFDVFALPTLKRGGKIVEQAGKIVAGKTVDGSSVAAQRLAGLVTGGVTALEGAGTGAKVISKGAFQGLVAGAPFAVVAQDDETAGSLLGAGVALGAAGGAGAGALRVVKRSAARRYFDQNRPVLPDVPSPDYGRDARLDGIHRENIQKLSAQDASELNNFREGLRQQGGEFYALDRPTWRAKMEEVFPNATPEQLDIYENHSAFFDQNLGDRKVVYLNADTTGLHHDAGHIFDAILAPEKRAELRKAVQEAFPEKAIADFQATYERRVGNKISKEAALDEFIAEQFAALFNNVPITELNAPKSLLSKFIDVAAEGAEALGIDLTAGATTPNLGAPVSVGIRQLFRNAAGEVMRANIEKAPADIIPFPGDEPPPSGGVPAPTPTPPPAGGSPATVIPLPRPPSRPIRPSGTDLPAPVTPEARAAAAARFAETGIENARLNAASDPVIARAVEDVSVHMEAGNPVLEVDHLGVVSEGTPDSPEGRTSRRATQAAGYEALKGELSRAGAPADLVASHLKTFVPVRWTQQGGTPTLVAMSLDKALQNIKRVGSDPKAAALIPYPTANGKLTAQGWRDAVSDLVKYSENQANGRRGDGGRLTVPEAGELSIPVENPNYTPQPLSPERADFQNLIMGLGTPETARKAPKGQTPGNVKGQILAEANLRPTETPASIAPRRAGSQAFVDFPPRTVQEVNPLRNRLKEAGVNTKELIEVTERIRAIDIEKVTPRPDISLKAPVTDIIRGGFQPAPTEFRQKNLGGRTVEEFSDYILKASPEEWKAATDNMTGGLTGGAWNLGLGLKEAADVGVLKAFQDKLSDATKAAMKSGDFDGAYSLVSKGQFFREAHEAATGTGSAGAAFKRGTAGMESAKPPFPVEGGGFLPAEQLEVGTAESRPPELRVLPAAPGGRPPIEPPGLRPPPVAAGFQPAEELQQDETPGVRVLPAAPGGRPPTDRPAVRPPPVAAGVAQADETAPPTDAAGLFLPQTEAGRKLEEKGFEIVPSGELGIRKVTIKDPEGADIAQIQAVTRSPERAEILFVNKLKEAPKGVGEVLYRELGAQLKADGITELTGTIVAPEPLAIRKKVFGDFKLIEMNGEPASYDDALAASDRIKRRTENEVAAIEPVNTISEATRFSPRVKRDAQGRPLKKNGDIDYPKWQAEGLAARKKQERDTENYVPIKKVGPKVKDEPKSTGWILPDKKFVPLDTNFHETYLAENAAELNKKFGTKFSLDESAGDDRLNALNSGFVRFRNYNGRLSVEANAARWPALKSKVLETLQDTEGQIDSLAISLLNIKGQEVDSVTAPRLFELAPEERLNKIEEAVDSLRVPAQ